jgi:hypothetical protein
MERSFVSAIALLALAGAANAQFGNVEFRWRERGTGLVTGPVQVPTTAASASTLPGGLNGANAASGAGSITFTGDARFAFILEARLTSSTALGLGGVAFSLQNTDLGGGSQFAASPVSASPDLRNAASASAAIYTGVGAYTPLASTTLPSGGAAGPRGIFAPFRSVADIGTGNQPAIGVQNGGSLNNIVIAANPEPLSFVDPDTFEPGPYNGRTEFYGLNTWVPIYIAVLNVADVSTVRDIVINAPIGNTSAGDSGVRAVRGINNAEGIDSWLVTSQGIPSLTLQVVPAPGAVALLGLGGLVAARRRRA